MYLTLLCIGAIVLAVYLHCRQMYTYFSRRGVKHFTPIPLLGNFYKVILNIESLGEAIEGDYKSFPEERFVGRYLCTIRQLVIRDLDLIKKITVKDFHLHFVDRLINVNLDSDNFLGRAMPFIKGQEWKHMRSTLSPALTGFKIRQMMPVVTEVGQQMIKVFKEKCQESKLGYIDVDVKDMTSRFTSDVIVSFAFGQKVDSFREPDNYIFANVRAGSSVKIRQFLVSVGHMLVPKLMKTLKIPLMSYSMNHVCGPLVKLAMQDREARNIIRPDLIQLLMEAKKRRLTNEEKTTKDVDAGYASTSEESNVDKNIINRELWSDDDLIAQAITFVMANFESTGTALTFLLHELALNPNVQEKLYQEIMENYTKNGGKLDYKSIEQMTYMDMVVSESQRLWPAVTVLDRACIKDYNCGKPNDKAKEDFIIRKGDGVLISILGIQRDPQYFPEPLKFDPERFSDENKHKIHPFSYMPFGLGPRGCIGSRFALSEMKVMVYQLLMEMKLSSAAMTGFPVQLETDALFLKLKECSIRMTPRN